MALDELTGTLITFSISSLCWRVLKDQERKITGASLLFANPRAAGFKMHLGPVRPSCMIPPQPGEPCHFQVGKWAVPVLCVCFPLGSGEVAFIRMGLCLHGLVLAGSIPGDAADEADGRNSGLRLGASVQAADGAGMCCYRNSSGTGYTKAASFDKDVRSLDTSAGELLPFLSQPSGRTWWGVSRGEQIPR